ncbi:MAG: nonstructural protein [Microvirus sp.]|nr:MAG: nonstructural protein [Microvirus sp.]
MLLNHYCIYDKKAQVFNAPFSCQNHVMAMRSVAHQAHDQNSMLSEYPTDYDLMAVGTWDDEQGCFVNVEKPEFIANVKQLIKTPEGE